MPNEPIWLSASSVIEQNAVVVGATGEPHGLLHPGLLASAVERPRSHYQYAQVDDVMELATVLLFALAENHPFEPGNKRTALTAARAFMQLNGYDLIEDDDASLADDIIAVIERRTTILEFRLVHQNSGTEL